MEQKANDKMQNTYDQENRESRNRDRRNTERWLSRNLKLIVSNLTAPDTDH